MTAPLHTDWESHRDSPALAEQDSRGSHSDLVDQVESDTRYHHRDFVTRMDSGCQRDSSLARTAMASHREKLAARKVFGARLHNKG